MLSVIYKTELPPSFDCIGYSDKEKRIIIEISSLNKTDAEKQKHLLTATIEKQD